MNTNEKIIIGKIGAARGLNGELKLIPLTDFEDRFDDLREVYVDEKIFNIEYVHQVSNNLVIKFFDCDNREFAQKLTNKFLKVDRPKVAPLNEGEFYTFDIIGLNVIDSHEKILGIIKEVLKTGSNDVYVAKSSEGNEILIPALKKVVKKIDLENKIMMIDENELEEI